MFSPKRTISLVKQGKFKVGVVAADGLGHLLLHINYFFVFIKCGSLAISAGAKLMNFQPI
jgi:hypothetical protein